MRTQNGVLLTETSDLESGELPGLDIASYRAQMTAFWWVRGYLAHPHPRLGVSGRDVCPWIKGCLERQLLWMTSLSKTAETLDVALDLKLLALRDRFLELDPRDGAERQFKALLVVFPDLPEKDFERVIDERQRRLKQQFVENDLMIGQFHWNCTQPGVRCPMFRPLVSPVPILAIRYIVRPADGIFMDTPALTAAFKGVAHNAPAS